jgi:hypothetical protein
MFKLGQDDCELLLDCFLLVLLEHMFCHLHYGMFFSSLFLSLLLNFAPVSSVLIIA